MDDTDWRLLDQLEMGVPLTRDPWRALGAEIGVAGSEVLDRLKRLCASGAVREMRAVLSSRHMGRVTTLAAVRTSAGRERAVAVDVARLPEVTHDYVRDGEFSVWIALSAADRGELDAILDGIRAGEDVEELVEIPAERVYKAAARFAEALRK